MSTITFRRILNATMAHQTLGMEDDVADVFNVNPTNDIIRSGVTETSVQVQCHVCQ